MNILEKLNTYIQEFDSLIENEDKYEKIFKKKLKE
jgi:hypothetical protein